VSIVCRFIAAISRDQAIDRETFDIARDTMYHRGPDASGSQFFSGDRVALGHRRLSIIDLSEAGNQKMQLDALRVAS
jgi:asparagine synthase (glutamine-hydrolysing)